MHIILKNHIDELAEEFGYVGFVESKLFEYFCNYCVVSRHFFGRFDPRDITTEEDDASLDGVAVIIDGDLITTADDAEEIFKTHKTNLSVDVIFTQCKSGEQFSKDEVSNFCVGLQDFLSLDPKLPNGVLNIESISILRTVLANLKKVKNRRPNAHVYYCTSGVYKGEREIKAAFQIIEKQTNDTDLFFKVFVTPVGRGEILKYYADLTEKNEAKLTLIDFFGMPKMPGIPQSYVGIVNAKHLVGTLLTDADGSIRQSVFEENVRSFLGEDNDVNSGITATLQDDNKKKLFSVLNNGLTIVSSELALTPNTKEINLVNYQIINGCQTSSTLFSNFEFLDDSVNVVVKFIESPDNEASGDIISATNSQTDIPKQAFFGLRGKAKLVQKYFDAQNHTLIPASKIYFERREGEFKGLGYHNTKIFDVREVARCYAAMYLNQPHNSSRYVKTIFSTSDGNLFQETDHESYYYCAALALYKYQALINGRAIGAHNYLKLRWHVIQVFKWVVHGKFDFPPANSRKADAYAGKIIGVLNSEDKLYMGVFQKCQDIIDSVGFPTDDALKRGKFTQDLMQATERFLVK